MYEELKRNLENVIKKESEKGFHSTGEIRIDWMAQECLTAINDLTTQLAEAKADYEAAVEDIKMIHDSGGDTCLACYHLDTNGECPFGWCNKSDEFRWRGRQGNG